MKPLIDGKYYVTMCGRVFAAEKKQLLYGRHPKPYYRTYPSKELKPYKHPVGYLTVGLWKNGERERHLVHRLVAQSFLPNPNNLPEVNHKDLDKSNNRVSNLEWVSREGNLLHAEENGRKLFGSSVGTSILVEEDVLEILELLSRGTPQTKIAELYGVSNHAIYRIAHGHNWSWLTGIGRKVGEECDRS